MDRDTPTITLVYGLGNPGTRYARTRHNMGFMVVDHLALRLGISVNKVRAGLLYGTARIFGRQVALVKPQTYMNLSGEPLNILGVEPGELVVVHDDMDIPFGSVRVKAGGGTGGHRGLESIRATLGTGEFLRIRVGIGRPPVGKDPSVYVLEEIPASDMPVLSRILEAASDAVMMCLRGEVVSAMNTFNRRDSESRPEDA